LDHTADIQFHAWGPDLKTAFEKVVVCMYGYMAELDKITINEDSTFEVAVEGHDLESLLFALMDEFLFQFSTEFIICKEIEIEELDTENFKIKALGKGERFNKKKHGEGTEIKAITYSNMQIIPSPNKSEVYVIVDI